MNVAAPLLLVGSPTGALLCGLPQAIGRAALLMLWSGASRRIARALTHPILCWIAGTGVVIAWHLPAAHELGMRSTFWHVAQHVTFFAAALLFWSPILDRGPGSARLSPSSAPLYLFLATLPCDALSAFLTFSGRVLYPSHALAHGTFGLTALQDQECAGALMWFWVTIAYLLPAVAVTLRMLSPRASEAVSAGQTLVNPLKVGAEVTVRS
jgi:putative membrane protein